MRSWTRFVAGWQTVRRTCATPHIRHGECSSVGCGAGMDIPEQPLTLARRTLDDLILRASNAIWWVQDFEELWMQITEFERLLDQRDPDRHDLDISDEAASGLRERIEALRNLLGADRP